MKIFVFIKPNSKFNKIQKESPNVFKVYVKEPAQEGRANRTLINLVAEYFSISKNKIIIIAGLHYKKKILKILA